MFSRYGTIADMLHGKGKAYPVIEVHVKIQSLVKMLRQMGKNKNKYWCVLQNVVIVWNI